VLVKIQGSPPVIRRDAAYLCHALRSASRPEITGLRKVALEEQGSFMVTFLTNDPLAVHFHDLVAHEEKDNVRKHAL